MRRSVRAAAKALLLAGFASLAACGTTSGSHVVRQGNGGGGSGGSTSTSAPASAGATTTSTAPSSGTTSLSTADALLDQLEGALNSLNGAVNQSTTDLSNPQGDS
jgi:hypothetical protein